jgi:hypothetical protein
MEKLHFYIYTPEMLRSKTIEKILMARHVVRFVIDKHTAFPHGDRISELIIST